MALEVRNLNKRFMFVKALDDFSVTFDNGKVIGLLGPNGSGKSTLMRILSGLLQKTSGEIVFESKLKGKDLRQKVAYMPTESHLYPWMKVKEIIDFYEMFFKGFDRQKVLDAIKVLDTLRSADVPKPYRLGATQSAILARGEKGVDLMIEQLKSGDRDFYRTGLVVARVLPGDGATGRLNELLENESSVDRQAAHLIIP